jgi:CspA family cold shock protein
LVLKLTEGTVKWFDNRKGYGFITTEEEGDIFVHYSAIVKEDDEYVTLNESDKVEFEITQGEKGPAASNVVVTEAAPAQVRDYRY